MTHVHRTAVAVLSLLLAKPAIAQRVAPVAVERQATPLSELRSSSPLSRARQAPEAPEGQGSRAWRGAGIGALVGILAGALVAVVIESDNSRNPNYPANLPRDKSEDGFAYLVFIPTGAVVGGIAGAIIGAARH
jgi:hypothetical protein